MKSCDGKWLVCPVSSCRETQSCLKGARPSESNSESNAAGPVKATETEGARCPYAEKMGEFACTNWFQCFEPCGRLGHDSAHMVVASEQDDIGAHPALSAAPSEAPTPETDALMEDLHLQHEHELLDGGEVFGRVEAHARRLELQRDAALSRERLANMRAADWEEQCGILNGQLALSASGELRAYKDALEDIAHGGDGYKTYSRKDCVEIAHAALASTAKREGEGG